MTNPTPKDPLQSATLAVPENERVESSVPSAYRLGVKIHDFPLPVQYVLQGCFKTYNEQGVIIHEWRDLETVEL
jgi:hypothetical protein